jgi:hypothetical protein
LLIINSATEGKWVSPAGLPRESLADLQEDTRKHQELANQLSLFDATAKPIKPCPMQFILHWTDQDGKTEDMKLTIGKHQRLTIGLIASMGTIEQLKY